jgi:hypothetical protein
MLARVIGVFKLDSKTFEEIEHNTSLTLYAAIIVALVALVSGVGSGIFSGISAAILGGSASSVIGGIFGSILSIILGWLAWSAITWFVGTRFFHGQADLPEMLRVIGFAFIPLVFSIIPCIGWLVGGIWAFLAGFIAIRQGLDLDNTKTFLTILLGGFGFFIIWAIFNLIIHI